jgi:CubicO group peptidase (beta-lactamase class C family)
MNIQKSIRGIIYLNQNGKEEIITNGYRQLTDELPINKETSFPTASAGKVFVAVGILKLLEEGKLTLDSTIGSILSFDLHQIDPAVTIKQLLTHTSGIPTYYDEEKTPDYADLWTDYPNYKIRTQKDLLPLFINEPMRFNKGEKFEYNDSGFVMLGLIIEELTQKPFDQYLEEILFQPLKMKYTGYYELDRLPKNCASAYLYDEDKKTYYTNIYSVDVKGTGAGGAFTNPIDIHRFWKGLYTYKILNKETINLMMYPHVKEKDFGYGLGIWLDNENNPYFVGFDPGVRFHSTLLLELNTEITLISNYGDNIWEVLEDIKEELKK